MGMFSIFSRQPQQPAAFLTDINAANSLLSGDSFAQRIARALSVMELYDFFAVYRTFGPLSEAENEAFEQREAELEYTENISRFAQTVAVERAQLSADSLYDAKDPMHNKHFKRVLYDEIRMEVDIQANIAAAIAASEANAAAIERRHNEMLSAITSLQSPSAYGDLRSVVNRHPILSVIFGAYSLNHIFGA